MAVTKKIEIDGKEVTFKASAAVPRLYRIKFGRDIYKDLRQLEKSVGENDEDNSNLDLFSLEMFEDLAWLMARHADPAKVPDSPEEFLDQFNTFSIYEILPQIIELDDRIPVKRRAIVGCIGSTFLFGVVCRRVKLRRGLITQWRHYAYVRRWCSGIRFGQRFSLFHGNGYDAAFEVRPPIGRLVAVDQVDTCYLFDRVIQTIGDIIKIIEILHTSFPFVILYFFSIVCSCLSEI